jgi:hypothetical protein
MRAPTDNRPDPIAERNWSASWRGNEPPRFAEIMSSGAWTRAARFIASGKMDLARERTVRHRKPQEDA